MPRQLAILFVGDAMVDVTVRTHESEPGGANPSDILISPGGLANIAVVARKEGTRTGLLGRVGRDPFGDFYEEDLISNGIESLLVRSDLPTGICINFVSPDSERTMYTSQGANSLLASTDLGDDVLKSTDMVFVSGFSMETAETAREITAIAQRGRRKGKKVAVGGGASNLISRRPDAFRRLVYEYADYLLLNEDEASALVGREWTVNGVKALEPLCDFVIVTRGSNGSTALVDGEIRDFATPKIEAMDTTGAGDVFAGVVLAGMHRKTPWYEIIPRAHVLASESAGNIGPR
jgi:sugar/nucleoside kinase (ribokinase family)